MPPSGRAGGALGCEGMRPGNWLGEGETMTLQESIRACLRTRYAEFHGKAGRSEFWWFALFVILAAAALACVSKSVSAVFLIGMLLPQLAVGARRLHDIG